MPPLQDTGEPGLTLWFAGLSGAGKTTLNLAVRDNLASRGFRVESLDGDEIRRWLGRGLGFSKADRDENIRRIGYVASLLTRDGVIVLASAIPYREPREEVRQMIGEFVEIYVNAPLAVCEQRDVKGLYRKARAGQLPGFTGIDDPYEPPLAPESVCCTDRETVADSVGKILQYIWRYDFSADETPRFSENYGRSAAGTGRFGPVRDTPSQAECPDPDVGPASRGPYSPQRLPARHHAGPRSPGRRWCCI